MSTLQGLAANVLATMVCCCSKDPHPADRTGILRRSMAILLDNSRTKPLRFGAVQMPKVNAGTWPYRDLLLWREDLVAVGQQCRPHNHNERVVERVVAGVATGAETIEGGGECGAVLGVDRLLQIGNRGADVLLHDAAAKKPVHVVKALFQFADLIVRQRPIAGMAGKPKFDVAHLLQRHDLAEAGLIWLFLRCRFLRRRFFLGSCRKACEHCRRGDRCNDRLHCPPPLSPFSSRVKAARCTLSNRLRGKPHRALDMLAPPSMR